MEEEFQKAVDFVSKGQFNTTQEQQLRYTSPSFGDSCIRCLRAGVCVAGYAYDDEHVVVRFYGLYKQALNGAVTASKPSFWDFVGKSKWYSFFTTRMVNCGCTCVTLALLCDCSLLSPVY